MLDSRSTTCDPRHLVDESERNRYRYDGIRTEHYNVECERLLGRGSRGGIGHGGATDRAQRMAENGEALKYIELVLRQLRRASRDHQELVRQRHTDFQHEISKRINERVWHHRDEREDLIDASRTWSRSSSSPWESDVTLRKTRPDVTTRLLTKRRNYGGTAQNTVDILRPGSSGRVRDEIIATTYQEMKYVPDNVDWKSARETFGAWNLPEASSNNDRKTSSTVV
ncbi:hypothetical protein ACFW04_004934 [Cataglyphis niger]